MAIWIMWISGAVLGAALVVLSIEWVRRPMWDYLPPPSPPSRPTVPLRAKLEFVREQHVVTAFFTYTAEEEMHIRPGDQLRTTMKGVSQADLLAFANSKHDQTLRFSG